MRENSIRRYCASSIKWNDIMAWRGSKQWANTLSKQHQSSTSGMDVTVDGRVATMHFLSAALPNDDGFAPIHIYSPDWSLYHLSKGSLPKSTHKRVTDSTTDEGAVVAEEHFAIWADFFPLKDHPLTSALAQKASTSIPKRIKEKPRGLPSTMDTSKKLSTIFLDLLNSEKMSSLEKESGILEMKRKKEDFRRSSQLFEVEGGMRGTGAEVSPILLSVTSSKNTGLITRLLKGNLFFDYGYKLN